MVNIDRRSFIASLGGAAVVGSMTQDAKADAIEHYLAANLAASDASPTATGKPRPPTVAELEAQIPTRNFRRGVGNGLVAKEGGNVTLLPPLPARPTLTDFIKLRLQSNSEHCLQSARLARRKNMDEDIVFACLVHDLVLSMVRAEHGFWSAQLFEPYVSEKVTFAIRHHATLRFFPDKEATYEYPELYRTLFGSDYVVPPHQQAEYDWVRKHRWYMAPRLVTVNDLYSFEPGVKVTLDEFEDLIGRHFRQPKEGLGMDGSSVAHMWRTAANPDAPL
ncbi:MAG: hypothetical protein ABI859_13945 [Pseudomonadota bacterium]